MLWLDCNAKEELELSLEELLLELLQFSNSEELDELLEKSRLGPTLNVEVVPVVGA